MADAFVNLGGVAGSLGAQALTTTGTITGGTITATTAFTSSSGYISIGATVAAAGTIRVANGTTIVAARNSANSDDFTMVATSGNSLVFGSSVATVAGTYLRTSTTGSIYMEVGPGAYKATISSSSLTLATGVALTLPGGPTVKTGTGTPESAVTAPVGSLFLRTDGGASTTLYVKESGSGNTGWVAK